MHLLRIFGFVTLLCSGFCSRQKKSLPYWIGILVRVKSSRKILEFSNYLSIRRGQREPFDRCDAKANARRDQRLFLKRQYTHIINITTLYHHCSLQGTVHCSYHYLLISIRSPLIWSESECSFERSTFIWYW